MTIDVTAYGAVHDGVVDHSSAVNTSIVGNDVRGYIQFDVQTSTIAAGTLMFTVTFAVHPYGAAPVVIVNNLTGQKTSSAFIAGSVTTNSFTVYNSATLPVTTQIRVGYHVIG